MLQRRLPCFSTGRTGPAPCDAKEPKFEIPSGPASATARVDRLSAASPPFVHFRALRGADFVLSLGDARILGQRVPQPIDTVNRTSSELGHFGTPWSTPTVNTSLELGSIWARPRLDSGGGREVSHKDGFVLSRLKSRRHTNAREG